MAVLNLQQADKIINESFNRCFFMFSFVFRGRLLLRLLVRCQNRVLLAFLKEMKNCFTSVVSLCPSIEWLICLFTAYQSFVGFWSRNIIWIIYTIYIQITVLTIVAFITMFQPLDPPAFQSCISIWLTELNSELKTLFNPWKAAWINALVREFRENLFVSSMHVPGSA